MSNLNENEQNTNVSYMKKIGSVHWTCFEDLSNELIYEVFDYLDSWDIHNIFSHLNIRFQHLFVSSNFHLKLTLPFISRTNFIQRCDELVKLNIDRMNFLSIVNCCAIELFFESFPIQSFIHLKTLILNDVTSNKLLIELLHSAVALPRLFTLCITSSIFYQDENIILQNIFRLPVIKYCKLSLDGNFERTCLPYATDKQHHCQSLKYLLLGGSFCLNQLPPILSYTPQLTHLLYSFQSGFHHPTNDMPLSCNLIDVTLKFHDISFNHVEKFLCKISGQLLRLRVTVHMNHEFLCADRWERLISNYMPHLQMFDFVYLIFEYNLPNDIIFSKSLLDRFKSSFWSNRQWFFQYQSWSCDKDDFSGIFYTTNPFRRKHYELYRCENYETTINSATHLTIGIDSIPNDCSIHFPNVTKLTLIENDRQSKDRSIININRIIPLTQVTHVIILDPHFSFDQLIKLLQSSSNIQSLTFIGVSFIKLYRPLTEQQWNLVRQISTTNKVIELVIADDCSLEYITLFVNLCPRLQRLEFAPHELQFKSIVRFLLSSKVSNLFWLCLRQVNEETKKQIQTMIRREKLLLDYSIEHNYTGLYLWW